MVKKMKISGKQGRQTDVSKVYDKEGVVKMGNEAVKVWKENFEEVLKGEQMSESLKVTEEEDREEICENGQWREDITREEVIQSLEGLKRKAAPGKDRLTVEMVCSKVLVDLWWELFRWCWKNGMVLLSGDVIQSLWYSKRDIRVHLKWTTAKVYPSNLQCIRRCAR